MREELFDAGTVIFQEGEPSEHVARLLEGEVEILRRLGGREVTVGYVGAGEYVGEMGVLEGRRRSATVRARTRVRVTFLDRHAFLTEVSCNAAFAKELLLRLSERLRATDDRIVRLMHGMAEEAGIPAAGSPTRVTILPGSPALAAQLPPDGITVTRFPFLIGRRPGSDERRLTPADLALEDRRPYRLSRHHFLLLRTPDGLFVADASSKLGTRVGEVYLGEAFPRMRAPLEPGENEVVAGGANSPYRFILRVE